MNRQTANLVSQDIKAGDAYLWNGPVCLICGHGYIEIDGPHRCSPDVLRARIAALQAKLAEVDAL